MNRPAAIVRGGRESISRLKGSTCPEFNEAAVRTAREDVYVPATRNGQPVSSVIKYKIRFKPADEPKHSGTDKPLPR